MIKISHLSKSYNKSSIKALDDLSLELKAGEIFGFLGLSVIIAGASLSAAVSSVIGDLAGAINSYILNSKFVCLVSGISFLPQAACLLITSSDDSPLSLLVESLFTVASLVKVCHIICPSLLCTILFTGQADMTPT